MEIKQNTLSRVSIHAQLVQSVLTNQARERFRLRATRYAGHVASAACRCCVKKEKE